MNKNKIRKVLFGLTIFALTTCNIQAQINIVGTMKNVMWKGALYGTINLDTISNKKHLYGLGPVEYLTGEILIIDGKSYKSTVLTNKTMKVEEIFKVKAAFFGYTNIQNWEEQTLSDSIQTLGQLETYLDLKTKSAKRPFMFKLTGTIDHATIHVVNLPKGSKVSSPDDAHNGQTNFELTNEQVDIIGFFSTEHQAIFTHHDTFLHMHLIAADKTKMGHLDKVIFGKRKIKLYLPTE